MQSMRGRGRWQVLLAALVLAAAVGTGVHAQNQNRFEIRNAYVELDGDTWLLDVTLDLALGQAALRAFADGVPLVLALDYEASVERRLLPDETVVSRTRRWQIAYDAISQRFVVTDVASGEHVSHASQEDALEALARLSGVEVADTDTLPPTGRFDMRVRASVDIGDVPVAMRMLLFWRTWSRTTDWYAWKVRP